MKASRWIQLVTASLLTVQVSAQGDLLGTLVSLGFSVYTEATSLVSSAASAASVASVASANGLPASTSASTTSRSSSSRSSTSSSSTTSSSSSSASSDLASSASASAASLASAASSASAAAASATNAADANNGSGGGKNNHLAIILGCVLGGLALGLFLLVLLLCCRRRRRGRRSLRSTSPTDREVGGWAGKHATASPPIVHNKTQVEVNAPPPGNGLPMSQHPGTTNTAMGANPFVPVPPAPRRNAPNSRAGLTDGAIPGDDPYLMEKGTGRPITPRKSHDSSHKGAALATGAGGAALGAAAMRHHNKHDGSGLDGEKHGLPMSTGPHTGNVLNEKHDLPMSTGPQTGNVLNEKHGLPMSTGPHTGAVLNEPRSGPIASHGHHVGPGTAALGAAGVGAAAMHHHNKNHNGHIGNDEFHTPPMIPGSQATSPTLMGHNRSMSGTLPTPTGLPISNNNRLSNSTPLVNQHHNAQNEALAGVGGAALGASTVPHLHRGNPSFIDEGRHDALFGGQESNTMPNSTTSRFLSTGGNQGLGSSTNATHTTSALPPHNSSSTGPALAIGAGGAALGAAAMHHHNRNEEAKTMHRDTSSGITGITQPSTRSLAAPSAFSPAVPLHESNPTIARGSEEGLLNSPTGNNRSHVAPVAAGFGGAAVGTVLGKNHNHNTSQVPDQGLQRGVPLGGASTASQISAVPSSGASTLLPSSTTPSTGISSPLSDLGSSSRGIVPTGSIQGRVSTAPGVAAPIVGAALTSHPHGQSNQETSMNTSAPLSPVAAGQVRNIEPAGVSSMGTSSRALASGPNTSMNRNVEQAPVPTRKSLDSSRVAAPLAAGAAGTALGASIARRDHSEHRGNNVRQSDRPMVASNSDVYEPTISDDRRHSLRSEAESRVGRKPVPTPIIPQPAPMPTTTSNDDAFALNKPSGRRSSEIARRSLSRDASRANAVFDNEYSQRPISSHGATAAAQAAATNLAGGSTVAPRRPNSHSRSPHRRLLLRTKDRSSDTSSSSNDYTDALPGANPFTPAYATRSHASVPATGPASGYDSPAYSDIPPAPVTRSRRNSALGTAAPSAAVFAYQNRSRSHSRSRSTSSDPDLPPIPSRSPKRNSFSNVPFDDSQFSIPPLRLPGRTNEGHLHDPMSPPMPSYPPNATPFMPADPNAPPASTADKAIVGDNGYPHMGVPRRMSSGAYDLEKHGPLGPPSISPPTEKGSGNTSDDSSWRLSSGMPGGWRRADERTSSLESSNRGSGGVSGARSPLAQDPLTDPNEIPLDRDITRDSGISGVSTGTTGKRLRAGDLRGGRKSEEISRGAPLETPEQMMARGRHSVEQEWTGNGGYDGYAYYHPDDMESHHVGTAL